MSAERRAGRLIEGYLDTRQSGSERPRDTVLVRSDGPFPMPERVWRLGDVDACLFVGGSMDATPYRREEDRLGEQPSGVAVGYVVDGTMQVSQDRRAVDLRAGQVALYDAVSPFGLRSEGAHRYLVAYIPARVLSVRHDDREVLLAQDLGRFYGTRFLAALLGAVVDVASVPAGVGQHLGEAIVAGTRAVMAEARGAVVGARSSMLFEELTSWLDEHLTDDGATADRLAAQHFLSARYVRKLFADHDTTVTAYVKQARLERIRDELLQPWMADVPVSVVAARWGFKEPSVFSRAFARQFGETPHSFRKDPARGMRRDGEPGGPTSG